MNLAVITCAAYSDAWPAFFGLLSKFWPDHPKVHLLTDVMPENFSIPEDVAVMYAGPDKSWCEVLRCYVEQTLEPFLLIQEDLLLTASVDNGLINEARTALSALHPMIGGVRVYPCPGADSDLPWKLPPSKFIKMDSIGYVSRQAQYSVSCQATIFRPWALRRLLDCIHGSAADFEIEGTKRYKDADWHMLSWKRDEKPWPVEYLCSAITRGKWNPDAKKLCDQHGIEVDWTRREFAA